MTNLTSRANTLSLCMSQEKSPCSEIRLFCWAVPKRVWRRTPLLINTTLRFPIHFHLAQQRFPDDRSSTFVRDCTIRSTPSRCHLLNSSKYNERPVQESGLKQGHQNGKENEAWYGRYTEEHEAELYIKEIKDPEKQITVSVIRWKLFSMSSFGGLSRGCEHNISSTRIQRLDVSQCWYSTDSRHEL